MMRKTLIPVLGALMALNAAGCTDEWWYDRWYEDSEVSYDVADLSRTYAQFTCFDYGDDTYGHDVWLSAAILFDGAADNSSYATLSYDGNSYDMDPSYSFFWGGIRDFNLYYFGYYYPDYTWFFQRKPEGLVNGSTDDDYYTFFCSLYEGELQLENYYYGGVTTVLDPADPKADFNGGTDERGMYDVACLDFAVPEATSCDDLNGSTVRMVVEDYLNGGSTPEDDPETTADERVGFTVDIACDDGSLPCEGF